jgi:phosphonate transport system permease protein
MAVTTHPRIRLCDGDGRDVERHWQRPGNASGGSTPVWGSSLLAIALAGSLWFANETNAGKFWDRLPHFFDFFGDMIPRDGWEIWRAMFDLESPYADGSLKYDYPVGRVY